MDIEAHSSILRPAQCEQAAQKPAQIEGELISYQLG